MNLSIRTPSAGRMLNLAILAGFLGLMVFAPDVMAQQTSDAQTKLCGVMGNLYSILKVASILIVTIAVIFAGYQIAFAHKRISDVSPILIGGLLIGAAAQIASLMIGNSNMKGSGQCDASVEVTYVVQAAAPRA